MYMHVVHSACTCTIQKQIQCTFSLISSSKSVTLEGNGSLSCSSSGESMWCTAGVFPMKFSGINYKNVLCKIILGCCLLFSAWTQ